LIREILQLQNYVVLEAGDHDEALALSREHGGRIDLMVVDVGIPPSFADEWVVRVRTSRPEIKVLYVSGYLSDSASVDAPKLGPLLQKPFTVGSFTKAIGLVLGRTKYRSPARRRAPERSAARRARQWNRGMTSRANSSIERRTRS